MARLLVSDGADFQSARTASPTPIFVSVKKARHLLADMSNATFYQMVSAGRIRTVKLGRKTLVPMASIIAFSDSLIGGGAV